MEPTPPDAMTRALGTVPERSSEEHGWRVLRACRWSHGPLHDHVAAMSDHVVMGYAGTPRRIERSGDGARVRSATRDDSVTIIPAGQAARWDIEGDLRVVHLYISQERLAGSLDAIGSGQRPDLADAVARPDKALATLVAMVAAELETQAPCALYADTLSEAVCLHLARTYIGGTHRQPDVVGRGLAPWQVARIKESLADVSRRRSLAELGALVNLSPKHLCTSFREATGLPPHAWAQQLRLDRAMTLLADRRKPLIEIALELGYESHSAFTAWFRRTTGRAPIQWRKASRFDDWLPD